MGISWKIEVALLKINKKPPKGHSNPPGSFTSASSGNTIFSSATPEGYELGWDIFKHEGNLIY